MKKSNIVIVTALALSMLFSGCNAASSSAAASSAAPSVPASSTASSVTAASSAVTSETTPSSAVQAAYSQEELKAALDSCCNFEADSAGGSLKAAMAAANIVTFSAKYGSEPSLAADAQAWYSSLSEDQLAALNLNWDSIYMMAQALTSDPASVADTLSAAGIETDFATMDMTNAASLMDSLNGLIK